MPVMDGVDGDPGDPPPARAGRQTPIIAMTANVLTHQQDGYREAGHERGGVQAAVAGEAARRDRPRRGPGGAGTDCSAAAVA